MFTHQRDHLRPHVVAIQRVNIEPREEALRRRRARFFMPTRTPATFEKLSRGWFAKVVGNSSEHHRDLFGVREIFNQLSSSICYQLRMNKDVAFRMPLLILRYVNED